jgi:hypothetical protein
MLNWRIFIEFIFHVFSKRINRTPIAKKQKLQMYDIKQRLQKGAEF